MASPSTKRRIALALAVLAISPIVVVLGFPGMRTRLQVSYHAFRLDSPDAAVRDEAALRLLAIGRPWIDEVYPRLVATYVGSLASGPDVTVLAGRVVQKDRATGNRDVELEVLLHGGAPAIPVGPGKMVEVVGGRPNDVSRAFERSDARRELLVVRAQWPALGRARDPAFHRVELAVPLDDDLSPAVLAAVRDVISH